MLSMIYFYDSPVSCIFAEKIYSDIRKAIYQSDTWRDDKTDTLYASDIIMEFK